MEILITPEYEGFSKQYQFTPGVKKGNFIHTSSIFGSVFKTRPDFLEEKDAAPSYLTKLGDILIGKGCVNQARIIMFHLENILKKGGAELCDIVNINISFMHKVNKHDMIASIQVIKSKLKKSIPPYTLGRMDFPALKGVLMQVSAVAQIS
jgi:hypothetical protein